MDQNGRQFQNVNDLKQCIQDEWEQLKQKNIKKLYKSLPKRMIAVIKSKGGATKY